MAVFSPKDLIESPRDTPCLFGLQFFIRSNRLICIATMRSQSVAKVMPYDVFLFTLLHEYIAARLKCEVGDYIHCCHSFHYYEDEAVEVREFLLGNAESCPSMPPMCANFASEISRLIELEEMMRVRLSHDKGATVSDLSGRLSPYSTDLFAILVSGTRQLLNGVPREDDLPVPAWSMI